MNLQTEATLVEDFPSTGLENESQGHHYGTKLRRKTAEQRQGEGFGIGLGFADV